MTEQIIFRLSKISTDQCALNNDAEIDDENMQLENYLNFGANYENFHIRCITEFTFKSPVITFIKLNVTCHYAIHETDWIKFIDQEKNKFVIPLGFSRYIAESTISTARGILHAKTENSMLNQYFIPAMDMETLISEEWSIRYK